MFFIDFRERKEGAWGKRETVRNIDVSNPSVASFICPD